MRLRTGFFDDVDDVSRETGLVCEDSSLTLQSQLDDSDINTIVRRFGLTGELPSNVVMPQSGDFADALDYHQSMNLLCTAQEQFMRFPADVRARFSHDPAKLIEFVEDGRNRDEAIRLGLVVPPVDAGAVKAASSAEPPPGA